MLERIAAASAKAAVETTKVISHEPAAASLVTSMAKDVFAATIPMGPKTVAEVMATQRTPLQEFKWVEKTWRDMMAKVSPNATPDEMASILNELSHGRFTIKVAGQEGLVKHLPPGFHIGIKGVAVPAKDGTTGTLIEALATHPKASKEFLSHETVHALQNMTRQSEAPLEYLKTTVPFPNLFRGNTAQELEAIRKGSAEINELGSAYELAKEIYLKNYQQMSVICLFRNGSHRLPITRRFLHENFWFASKASAEKGYARLCENIRKECTNLSNAQLDVVRTVMLRERQAYRLQSEFAAANNPSRWPIWLSKSKMVDKASAHCMREVQTTVSRIIREVKQARKIEATAAAVV